MSIISPNRLSLHTQVGFCGGVSLQTSPWGSTRYIVLIDHFLVFLLMDSWDIFCVVESCLETSRFLRVSVGGIGSGFFWQREAGVCTTFFEKMLLCSTLDVHEGALKYLCIIAIISSTLRLLSSISVTVLWVSDRTVRKDMIAFVRLWRMSHENVLPLQICGKNVSVLIQHWMTYSSMPSSNVYYHIPTPWTVLRAMRTLPIFCFCHLSSKGC